MDEYSPLKEIVYFHLVNVQPPLTHHRYAIYEIRLNLGQGYICAYQNEKFWGNIEFS